MEEKPQFQHPQSQSMSPAYGQVYSDTPDTSQLLQTIEDLTNRVRNLENKRINFNTDLVGPFETVTAIPTATPPTTSPYDQIKIYGTTLYFYNYTSHAWQAAGGSGGTPGGSDTQIQFNDGGSFGGNAKLTFDKAVGGALSLAASNGTVNTQGGSTSLSSGNAGSGTAAGGDTTISAGHGGTTAGAGGGIVIQAGNALGGNSNGGDVSIFPGTNAGSGHLGNITLGGSIGTSQNGGYIIISNGAGTPTGTPTVSPAMYYDTTNNKLYMYNSAWKSVTLT